VKPDWRTRLAVSRFQWQLAATRAVSGTSAVCMVENTACSERTCSAINRRPPGLRTRSSSLRLRCGSATEQNTSVITAVSNVSLAKGSASAGAWVSVTGTLDRAACARAKPNIVASGSVASTRSTSVGS
jgi:hypothetical protein